MLAGLAAVVAISVGIPVGMLIHWFSKSSNAALSTAAGNLQYLLPASRTSIAARYRLGARGACSSRCRSRCSRCGYAGPVVTAPRARDLPLVRAARSRRRDRARPTRRATRRGSLYGSFALLVFAEAILFVPFAVVAMRATLGQIEPALEDSARSLGAGPLATLLAGDAAAGAPRLRWPRSCSSSPSRSATSRPRRCCSR